MEKNQSTPEKPDSNEEVKVNPLTEIDSIALIDEVCRRFPICIVIGRKNEGGDDGGGNTFWSGSGSIKAQYGLLHEFSLEIQAEMMVRKLTDTE